MPMPTKPQDLDHSPDNSLDPRDWPEFRQLCTRVLDQLIDYISQVRDRPVWKPMPPAVLDALKCPLPVEPQQTSEVCDEVTRLILPYVTGNIHPHFLGWVVGGGTPVSMLAEMFTAAMNINAGGRDHGATQVEHQVLEWCRQIFGFPDSTSGLIVSGTSMATVIALCVARNAKADVDIREHGLAGNTPLVGYTSVEAHDCVSKAFELLGLGRQSLRKLPVDDQYRLRIDDLQQAVQQDREAGRKPFCVIGTAGTVNTGAIDDLQTLADFCREQSLWFHIDGAIGAAACVSDQLRHRLAGIERADSLAFDFHKWLQVTYDAGCVLIRREDLHAQAFAGRQSYLESAPRGLAGGGRWFCEYGPEMSRAFRALKVWFTFKNFGVKRLGRKMQDLCDLAEYLADRVTQHPGFELIVPVNLNIVCFRFVVPSLSNEQLNHINGEIVMDLQEQGIAAPSTTMLRGTNVIRVSISNHRTTRHDLDTLIDAIGAQGEKYRVLRDPP